MPGNVVNMFSVKETPWHKIGTVLDNPPRVEDAIAAAGLDWRVDQSRLFTAEGSRAPAYANVKADDGQILGVTGERYQPLQNDAAFAFFNPILDRGEASLETAGALDQNRKVWVMAKLNRDPILVGPDEVDKYILLSNSHDGTTSVRVGFTPVRVVCQNTLHASFGARGAQLIRVKHTARTEDTLKEIRETMNLIDEKFEATAEQYKRLARKEVNQGDLERYIKTSFELPEDETGSMSTRARNILDQVKHLTEKGHGNDQAGVRGTWWAAYNGVVEYLQYHRTPNDDKRLNSLWYGSAAQISKRALSKAVDYAA